MSSTLSNNDALRRVEELEFLLQSQKEQYENQIKVLSHKISQLEANSSQPKSPHSFQVQTSLGPSMCGVCSSVIFAFPKSSACVCDVCKFVAHPKCAPFAPSSCKQANLRTSIHRPDSGADVKQITETALKSPEKSGFLYKKGESNHKWKKYYFALAEGNLFYFKDTSNGIPKDIINLSDALIHVVAPNQPGAVTSRKHAFVIHTKEKSLILAAENATDLSQWTQHLMQLVQRATEKRAEVVLQRLKISPTSVSNANEAVGFQWDSILHIKIELPSVGSNVLPKHKKLSLDPQLAEQFGISTPNSNNNLLTLVDEEAQFFRLKTSCMVSTIGIDQFQLLTAAVTPAPLPQDFPEKFHVSYRYSSTLTKSVECSSDESVKANFCKFLKSQSQMVLLGININMIHRYLLKIIGYEEFVPIEDAVAMSNLVFVRNCIKKRKKIEFLIVDMDLVMDTSTRVDTIMIKGAFKQKFTQRVFDNRHIQGMSRKMVQVYPSSEVHKPFEIKVICLQTFDKSILYNHFDKNDVDGGKVVVFVEAAIYFGSEILGPTMYTRAIPASLTESPLWCDWLRSKVLLSSIPRESRLSFTLYACRELSDKVSATEYWMTATKQGVALAWVNVPICDYRGVLHTELQLNMWYPGRAKPTASCMQNTLDDKFKLVIEFQEAPKRIAFLPFETNQNDTNPTERTPSKSDILRIEQLIATDPIRVLTDEEKTLLWNNRHLVTTYPQGLSKFILSAPWTLPTCRRDIWTLVDLVGDQLSPLDALELLDSNFPYTEVREFAVNRLNLLSDLDLVQFLPQLVQVLIFENYHCCPLAEFLIYRGLKNQKLVGHYLFWRLKSELHSIQSAARFRLILEAYLIACGQQYRDSLLKQVQLMEQLTKIAEQVKAAANNKKTEVLKTELKNLNFPPKFKLPLFPNLELSGIDIESCRWMDSATYPLWLVFGNTDSFGRKVSVIFKVGDDLRQDMLTLQIIRILDNLWKEEGLDLHLTTYGCIATGKGVGLIEVVSDSKTTADIHKKEGAVTGAFKKTSLANWLQQYNPTPEEFSNAVNNFMYSCAAYSVVTYALGIADRHNDNVMLTTEGHLFHIDFGHFLGNYLKFGAFKRETAPFTLTPEMAYVMGGEKGDIFRKYVEYCVGAYNIVRKHSNMLLTLFAMMISSGLPQLQKFEDIYYLRDALKLGKTEQQAAEHFQQLIKEALGTQRTVLNNAIHMLVHPN